MKSLLHVISGLDTGGAETMLVRLASELKRRGFAQHVVSIRGRGTKAKELEAAGVPVTALDLGSMISLPGAVWQLTRLVQALRPDILQGWMYHGDIFAALAHRLAAGRKSRKLLWNIRASDTDQGGYGWLLRIAAQLSSWPDMVLANSRAGLDFHIAQGYRPRRSDVIANGIDETAFKPDVALRAQVRTELGLARDAVVAIHVARVNPMKDHASFLAAMAEAPALRGLLVGAGTEALIRPANVEALGVRNDMRRLYAAADIVVSTSVFAEGFSNIIAEGMSCGLVPITTDVGDSRMIVGDAGRIVPIRKPAALAEALNALAFMPVVDRETLGQKARTRVEQNFTLRHSADRFEALYAAL